MSTQTRVDLILATLRANNGRFCGVTFTKKNGETRRMNCIFSRAKVESHRFQFNPLSKGLIPVWDVKKAGIRFINARETVTIKADGLTFQF